VPPAQIGMLASGLGHTGSRLVGLLGFTALGLTVTMIAAVLSFHLYEQPFLRLKRFFESRARPAAARGASIAKSQP
jgi:peptidoglycan/LPS O-acetylase OafA/YrhL